MRTMLMYGRGAASIAEQTGSDVKEAQKIIDDFYNGFPKVKQWVTKTQEDAKILGYVEDLWGRRRRLPDLQLPKYTITDRNQSASSGDMNPLLGAKGLVQKTVNPNIEKYRSQLEHARGWQQVKKIRESAQYDKIDIRDNGMFISQAERQCVNARVQGAAATMSKLAMIAVYKNEALKDLGFRMLLQVHDELIGECPKENADKVAELLSSVMKSSAKPVVSVPFKCDAAVTSCWYEDAYESNLRKSFKEKLQSNDNKELAYAEIAAEHTECTDSQIRHFLSDLLLDS